jgi:hypothetical protein
MSTSKKDLKHIKKKIFFLLILFEIVSEIQF